MNQNSIQQEIKCRLMSVNACYHLVQIIFSLPVCYAILYGCETWSPTLREECRLRVFENRVLRIFGPKRDAVTVKWWKMHNEKFNDLYSTLHIIQVIKSRRMRWAGHVACMRGEQSCIQVFGGETRGKETTWKTQAQTGV